MGGDRSQYAPVRSVLAPGLDGDALALARAYRAMPGVSRCYVADLDAIAGGAPQHRLLTQLQSADGFGGTILLDAGVDSPGRLDELQGAYGQVIVGLETLRSFATLARIAGRVKVTFSLDLRNDVALAEPSLLAETGSADPVILARAAIDAGARSLILLDVARVGRGVGVNLELLAALRRELDDIELLAGGGVKGAADITVLEREGCDGVLIATALHRGTIQAWSPGPGQSRAREVR